MAKQSYDSKVKKWVYDEEIPLTKQLIPHQLLTSNSNYKTKYHKMENNNQNQRTVQIGSLRNIRILGADESILISQKNKDYIYSNPHNTDLFPNDSAMVIGYILFGYPILSTNMGGKVYVMTDDKNEASPICIANDISTLHKILDIIEAVWNGRENEARLVKNDLNLAKRKDTLEKIAAISPNSDLSIWDWIAFEELTISLS